ncbi:unnamed protein product [Linum trigynum]|uniref:Glycosyltransferase family 92 protein n=1 Tax=Linum trigynum TaxID=586398 RepID=A0AAV2ESB9_9ROSI
MASSRRAANQTADEENSDSVPGWGKVVYEAILDWNTVVVLAKGLNLKPRREVDPAEFRCHFSLSNNLTREESFVFTTEATVAAQEVVRCLHPEKQHRACRRNPRHRQPRRRLCRLPCLGLPCSSAIGGESVQPEIPRNEREMGREVRALRLHDAVESSVGFEGMGDVPLVAGSGAMVHLRQQQRRRATRRRRRAQHAESQCLQARLAWIKAQEAGFSHCALRAKYECKWVGFFDVDEFFYFPHYSGQTPLPGQNSLRAMVSNYTDSPTIAEVRTMCHSFGPSGLTEPPKQGVTVGYTCRLQAPERHKSFVRPDLLDMTLLNIVHHFKLREGYKSTNVAEGTEVINHYKYQVWDTFKAKFFRRVSTYVTNWQDDHMYLC